MTPRPQPPANDGPLDVLVATEPHEESSLGPVARFLLRHRRLAIALLAVATGALLLFAWTLANGEEIRGKVIAVAVGDTLTVLTAEKQQHRIRLAGIDAPEKGQAFGARSRQHLTQMTHGKDATLQCHKTDRYQRKVCKVMVRPADCPSCGHTLDIGLAQVLAGFAWWYLEYASEQSAEDRWRYESDEQEAKALRRGLWGDRSPVPPWKWREVTRRKIREGH